MPQERVKYRAGDYLWDVQGKTGARVKDRRKPQNDNRIARCNCGTLGKGWTKSKLPHR
jgi:hypothetical protein